MRYRTKWQEYTVEELVEQGIIEKPMDGNHGGIHPKGDDFTPHGIPFIMASDLNGGRVDYSSCKFISEEQATSLRKGFSKNGDVLLTHKATIGRTAIVENSPTDYIILTPQVTYYRIKDSSRLNNKYLRYYFDSKEFQDIFNSWAGGGSTRAYLGITAQGKLPIRVPEIHTQRRIAAILSAFDDKIELNRQMNRTLEEMAQALFREMCVPKGGEVPEGWEWKTIGDLYSTTSGGTPSRMSPEYYQNGEYLWVKSKELNDTFVFETEEKITEDALNNSSAKLIPKYSLLVAMYGATVGQLSILGENATCNQAICAILPNENYTYSFIYSYLKEHKDELMTRAVGSAQQNISQLVIKSFEVLHPPIDIIQGFQELVASYFEKILNNLKENNELASIRDSLLIKLMNGQIDL